MLLGIPEYYLFCFVISEYLSDVLVLLLHYSCCMKYDAHCTRYLDVMDSVLTVKIWSCIPSSLQ